MEFRMNIVTWIWIHIYINRRLFIYLYNKYVVTKRNKNIIKYIYIYWQKLRNKLIVCEFIYTSLAMKWKWLELKQHKKIMIQTSINNTFFLIYLYKGLGKETKYKEICEWLDF